MRRRLVERVIDHNGKDAKSHIFKHAVEKNHKLSSIDEFGVIGRRYNNSIFKRKIAGVIGRRYNNSIFKRKIAGSFLIKELRPSSNI